MSSDTYFEVQLYPMIQTKKSMGSNYLKHMEGLAAFSEWLF